MDTKHEIFIKEAIARGDKFIPFSEETLTLLPKSPKQYPLITIARWKKAKKIPIAQFKKVKVDTDKFSFLLYLKNINKQGIRVVSIFKKVGVSEENYSAYFFRGTKIPDNITTSVIDALNTLKQTTLKASIPADLASLLEFFVTTKLSIDNSCVQKIKIFKKSASITPDTLNTILSALKQKVEIINI